MPRDLAAHAGHGPHLPGHPQPLPRGGDAADLLQPRGLDQPRPHVSVQCHRPPGQDDGQCAQHPGPFHRHPGPGPPRQDHPSATHPPSRQQVQLCANLKSFISLSCIHH